MEIFKRPEQASRGTGLGTTGSARYCRLMPTPKEYLKLAERYRSAKLDARDRTSRHLLDRLERSYRVLARCTLVLSRSRRLQKALGRRSK
jgi:hypothetical protein